MNYIDKISHTTVGKILKENSLKPHLVEEWCIPKEQSADFCFKQRYPDEWKRIIITMISAFDMRLSRWYLRFLSALNVYFAICASKTLQKSSAIQKISVTLSSVIIAKFFSFIVFIQYKVTKNFANYQIFNELYFIELTLFIICCMVYHCPRSFY